MSEHVAHTEKLGGLTLKIILDDMGHTESPLDDGTNAVIFAVLHRRYANPAESFDLVAKPEGSEEPFYDFTTPEGIADFEKDMADAGDKAEWVAFPLFMYDHSGTIYKASEGGNPFSCQWDSGRIGIIALKKSEFYGPDHAEHGKPYIETANGICDNYTEWANGEIYGYVVEDETGEQLDSCWGFIGTWDSYVLEQGRDMLKSLAKDHEPQHEFKFSRNEADLISAALMHSLETEFVSGAKYNEADRKGVEALLERIKSEFPFEGYTAAEVAAEREETV